MSVTVEGLHRGGQDDWDSHAARFNNRIIRSSTRLSTFGEEMSDWYQGKIIPTDVALAQIGLKTPDKITYEGKTYIKSINGYILEGMENNPDVKRGLYMLSIPSNFIFKINLTEYAHVFKERNIDGTANPEVKLCCEDITEHIESFQPIFNRELLNKIKN
jgi:thymidylate synthase ThyX